MRENLSGRNGSEKFPINWDQPPSHKGGDCGNEPGNFLRLCGISALATASPSVGGQDRHLRTLSVVEALVPSACLFSSAFDIPQSRDRYNCLVYCDARRPALLRGALGHERDIRSVT